MKQGYLSQYFEAVGLKRLSAVEADVLKSNQHEFNGVEGLRKMLGEPADGKQSYSARFLYLNDHDDEPVSDDGYLTWYDARQKARLERGVMRTEYRLYFPTNLVSQCAAEGDLLVIAKYQDKYEKALLAIVAERGSTIERQLLWLFGQDNLTHPGFSVKSELETDQDRIGFATRVVLEQIGVELVDEAPNYLEEMLKIFGGEFPKTVAFSAYARNTIRDINSRDDPDSVLMAWMEKEEILYRTLEKHLLGQQIVELQKASEIDTDAYMKVTLSFQQRRKSRAGSALENHLEQIFTDHKVTYSRTQVTENNLKPDFIFPDIKKYHDDKFNVDRLTMLAAKTTCKDRWRQIINEAARIPLKHLITLEPSISENQTNEMKAENVQLVIPQGLFGSYKDSQINWLMNLDNFIGLASSRQL